MVQLVDGDGATDRLRRVLFTATGIPVPLDAFPVSRVLARRIGPAAVLSVSSRFLAQNLAHPARPPA